MKVKKFWKCTVCGDKHYGVAAPNPCPTCGAPASKAIEISKDSFLEGFI